MTEENEINIICLDKNNEQVTIEEAEKEYYAHKKKARKMIRHELKNQNGRACMDPQYCVIELRTLDSMGLDCCGGDSTTETMQIMREIFFTNKEAEQYIEENKHEHKGELFIYVKSGYRNEGWQMARELMLNNKEGE